MKDFYKLLVNDEANFEEDPIINEIMSILPPSPDDVKSTMKYLLPYINHIPSDVIKAREQLIKYIGESLRTRYFNNIDLNIFEERKNILESFNINSIFCNPGFYTIWRRFASMDDDFREWSFIPKDIDNLDISKCSCLNEIDSTIKSFYRDNKLKSILG